MNNHSSSAGWDHSKLLPSTAATVPALDRSGGKHRRTPQPHRLEAYARSQEVHMFTWQEYCNGTGFPLKAGNIQDYELVEALQ